MFLIVGWSSVVFWLNVRPRRVNTFWSGPDGYVIKYGFPLICSEQRIYDLRRVAPHRSRGRFGYVLIYWPLAANIAIGLLAVAVLTFASKYLLRAIVAGLRRFVGKPPPAKEEGD